MFFKIHVLYIQESQSVYAHDQATEDERTQLITDLCKKYGFTFTVVPLETVYTLKSQQFPNGVADDLDSEKYKKFHAELQVNQIIASPGTNHVRELLSAVEPQFQADLVLALKKHLITDFCLRYNFKRVLLATTGHSIACKLIG